MQSSLPSRKAKKHKGGFFSGMCNCLCKCLTPKEAVSSAEKPLLVTYRDEPRGGTVPDAKAPAASKAPAVAKGPAAASTAKAPAPATRPAVTAAATGTYSGGAPSVKAASAAGPRRGDVLKAVESSVIPPETNGDGSSSAKASKRHAPPAARLFAPTANSAVRTEQKARPRSPVPGIDTSNATSAAGRTAAAGTQGTTPKSTRSARGPQGSARYMSPKATAPWSARMASTTPLRLETTPLDAMRIQQSLSAQRSEATAAASLTYRSAQETSRARAIDRNGGWDDSVPKRMLPAGFVSPRASLPGEKRLLEPPKGGQLETDESRRLEAQFRHDEYMARFNNKLFNHDTAYL